jgi:hypothetical protein
LPYKDSIIKTDIFGFLTHKIPLISLKTATLVKLTDFYITPTKTIRYGICHSERSLPRFYGGEESQGQNTVLAPDASLRSA